ncbi:MAG: hypothetical protein ACLP4V_08680 [Methylocella sp.]
MVRRPDADMLMELVPEDGSFVGNGALIAQLGWKEDKYWKVRKLLLENGQLERGRGKGGSVHRSATSDDAVAVPKAVRSSPEARLYEPLLRVLSSDWVREMRIEPDQIHFEITARQGKKATGGTWTRPDITAVSVRTFQHLPGKYFDAWTFEVKPIEALDVTAVFEAASHASRATRSYALVQVSDATKEVYEIQVIERCVSEAARLRVGLILFSSDSDFKTWETKVEAPRLDTTPENLDEFVGQLSETAKAKLARWK